MYHKARYYIYRAAGPIRHEHHWLFYNESFYHRLHCRDNNHTQGIADLSYRGIQVRLVRAWRFTQWQPFGGWYRSPN